MIDISNWVHSIAGGFHVFASFLGLAAGAFVLLGKKGTKVHKIIGYIFVASLALVNISAMFIYDFNQGSPSVFHLLVPVSLFFLVLGMYPMIRRRKTTSLNRLLSV